MCPFVGTFLLIYLQQGVRFTHGWFNDFFFPPLIRCSLRSRLCLCSAKFLYRMGSAYRLHRRTCYTKKEPPRRILEVLFVYISLRCFVCMSATAMIQLGNRCATVVAKWSRSLQRTCSSPQKTHRCLSDVVY